MKKNHLLKLRPNGKMEDNKTMNIIKINFSIIYTFLWRGRRMKFSAILFYVLFSFSALAQENNNEQVIDRVIAVVGNNPVLLSELESQYQQMVTAQDPTNENSRCKSVACMFQI